ncbi:MAG: hypothetical protein ACI8RZ_000758 [Myxococcota bacterium]|jgi:hypothetical protein
MRLGLVLGLLLATGCGVDNDNDGVTEDTDCDDTNALVSPNATEICDGLDNDCDNEVDESVQSTYYLDADGDGYGIEAVTIEDCDVPEGYAGNLGDCDDYDASISPGEDEICDYVDNDCDNNIDENATTIFYYDGDGDGVGTDDSAVEGCAEDLPVDPTGAGMYVTEGGDCDDSDPAISPNASEVCDGIDNDCEGEVDDDYAVDAASWYIDSDGDGYGLNSDKTVVTACVKPSGYVDNVDDCDDNNIAINPDGEEICDGDDNDCSGEADEAEATDATTWYGDADGDGYGGMTFSTIACSAPTSYVETMDDCDDLDDTINPGADEVCDEVDNDCNSLIDDDDAANILYVDDSGVDVLWYIDADGDSYGTSNFSLAQCNQPNGYVRSDDSSLDCNDLDDDINPGLEEVCDDGKDNNCDESPTPCALEDELAHSDADFTISGASGKPTGSAEDGDQFGRAVAVGDFNGDGDDDLLVGANGVNGDNTDDGAAYVFFGPLSDATMDADDADAILWGDADADDAGYAVAAADLDGDGYDEVIVTAYGRETFAQDSGAEELSDAGQVYIFYGSSDAATAIGVDAILADDAAGLLSGTEDEGHFGCALTNAGDINGDNRDDLVIGTCIDGFPGTATLIYGSDTRFAGEVYPQDEAAASTDGYAYWNGVESDSHTGEALAGLGDVDGDGVDDFGVGAYAQDVEIGSTTYADAGVAYVIFGDGTEHFGELEIDTAGAYFYGENAYDNAGVSVSGAGDTNGDGYDDFLVGASGYDLSSTSATNGAAYLILGSATLNGELSEVARIIGENQYDQFGDGVGMVGDLDDDGYDDIAIGAVTADGNNGAAYLFYGPVSADLDASEYGAKFTGNTAGDGEFGRVIAGPGDLNGDGERDMIIGAGADDGDGSSTATDIGGLYIFGGGGL